MNIKPLSNRVLLQLDPEETMTKGGILLPSNKVEKSPTATVLAIGCDVKEVKIGDKVWYKRWASEGKEVGGMENQIIVLEEHIVAVIEE